MVCPVIDNPTSCKMHAVIHFFHTKNMSAAEIHCVLCAVYSQNVMTEGTVRQWCRMFIDGRTNVHNKNPSGRLSVVSDDRVQSERLCFTISKLLFEIP
jgi:hypothetical protein